MQRGRPPKNKAMQQQSEVKKLPHTEEGDVIKITLEMQRVSNGFIITNKEPDTKAGIMVFNGPEAHRTLAAHVLLLALADMKEGEIIDFSSQMTFTKKIPQ